VSEASRFEKLIDVAWRTAFRLGFPVALLWWRLSRPRHEGAMVAVHVGPALLLVRSSYRSAWSFPGGGLRRGEAPEAAARRELIEEIGLRATAMLARGVACGIWDGRRDRVYFFDLRLDRLPELRLDNREIVAARLVSPEQLRGMRLTGPVVAYLGMPPPSSTPAQAAVSLGNGHAASVIDAGCTPGASADGR
jgi:8-oxo-dGTP diphosphatase